MSEIEHVRADLSALRSEIRDLTSAVSKYMQTTEASIARLSTISEGHSKQITELWRHVNEITTKGNELSNRIQAIEGASTGVGKMIGMVAAVAAAVAGIIALVK